MSMGYLMNEIEQGKKGLSRIINDSKYLELIDRFQVNEDVRERIRKASFSDLPTFYSKKNGIWPSSQNVSGLVINADEIVIKWFLLLDGVSSSMEQLSRRFLAQIDDRFLMRLSIDPYQFLRQFDLYEMTDKGIATLVDDFIDVYGLLKRYFLQQYNGSIHHREHLCQTVSLFTLSAGYNLESFPATLLQVNPSMPFIFASSRYISMMTGKDETEVLNEVIKENGAEKCFDELLMMKRKKDVRDSLEKEKRDVEFQLSRIKERIRRHDTEIDVLADSFGMNLPDCEVQNRIIKCNDPEHWEILCKLESIARKELSIMDKVHETGLPIPYCDLINKEYRIIISEKEVPHIKTVEDLIDTIIAHKRFIERFKEAVKNGSQLDIVREDDPYDLDVRIKEIEFSHHCYVNRDNIYSLDDLLKYVIEQYAFEQYAEEKPSLLKYILRDLIIGLTEYLGLSPGDVSLESYIMNDLGADSLDTIQMQMEAEKRYGISIPDKDAAGIQTVRDFYNLICEKLSL